MFFDGKISVVVISRNEEKNIARCLDSVMDAVKDVDHEIILVDSSSEDNTIEIAKDYPITILKLRSDCPLSAAAGRYVGYLYSKGKYVQFQDGDTLLDIDWFRHSIPYLEEHPDVAGVVGTASQQEYDNVVAKIWAEECKTQEIGQIDHFGADILLKREVLENVGTFNPHIRCLEEEELCYRIISGKYKLFRLPVKMFHHMGGADESYIRFIKRKQKFATPCGQIFGYSKKDRHSLAMYWKHHKYIILYSSLMLYFIPSFLFILNDFNYLIYSWIVGMILLILYMAYEQRSLTYAIKHTMSMFIYWPFFLRGILSRPKDIKNYPIDVDIIKTESQSSSVGAKYVFHNDE